MLLIFILTSTGVVVLMLVLFPVNSTEQQLVRLSNTSTPNTHSPSLLKQTGQFLEPYLEPLQFARPVKDLLFQAGSKWRLGEFMTLIFICGLAGICLGLMLIGLDLKGFIGACLMGLVCAVVPFLQLKLGLIQRQKHLNEQLPEALMLIVNAIRGGNSLPQALGVIGTQMQKPIGPVFAQTITDVHYGLPMNEALSQLEKRFGGLDMRLVTQAILIQRETGGNLAEILANITRTIRDRQTVQGEMRALTAQGRLSGLVLSLLPVGIGALFFIVNRPYIVSLFIDKRGQMMVVVSIIFTLIGMFFIQKIVQVDY
jgi:tight adherence protein B